MLEFLLDIDQDVFLFFNGFHSPFWDRAMFMFSGRFIWVPMYFVILVATFRSFNLRIAITWTIAVALCILLADQFCATICRPLFERLRPANLENPLSQFVHIVNDYRGGRYGFPSCHAANSFALATILACIWRGSRLKWFIFIWAVVNSYSRVYLGVHYPGDLLVGAIVGSLIGLLVFFAARAVVWEMVKGDMKSARPKQRYLHLNNYVIPYRTIDIAVLTGILTMLAILLITID